MKVKSRVPWPALTTGQMCRTNDDTNCLIGVVGKRLPMTLPDQPSGEAVEQDANDNRGGGTEHIRNVDRVRSSSVRCLGQG